MTSPSTSVRSSRFGIPKRLRQASAIVLLTTALAPGVPVRAQAIDFTVYDPINWIEAVAQVFYLVEDLLWTIWHANRLPVDMTQRYRVSSPPWTLHELGGLQYAEPILRALNTGDPGGGRYRQVIDLLDLPNDIRSRMPAELRRRLGTAYATVELADSIATRGVDEAGTLRANSERILEVIDSMEEDAGSRVREFHTETALLNKINGAVVLGLRLEAQTNQFLLDALEQLVVDNKRKRDSEAKAINSTIHQWRYGQTYGASLFSRTASNLDTWRQR
jgi:hypothetical protein